MFSTILCVINLILLIIVLFAILSLKKSFKAGWDVLSEALIESHCDTKLRLNFLLWLAIYIAKRLIDDFIEAEDYKNAQMCKNFIDSINKILSEK